MDWEEIGLNIVARCIEGRSAGDIGLEVACNQAVVACRS